MILEILITGAAANILAAGTIRVYRLVTKHAADGDNCYWQNLQQMFVQGYDIKVGSSAIAP